MGNYVVACQFEPQHRRLGGQRKGSKQRLVKRGAWRVRWVAGPYEEYPLRPVETAPHPNGRLLVVPSTEPRPRGSLCDPRKLLREWQGKSRA